MYVGKYACMCLCMYVGGGDTTMGVVCGRGTGSCIYNYKYIYVYRHVMIVSNYCV